MTEVSIIGGGLAGLVNAIHLAQAGLKVVLFEKNGFPKHKVCGEYISNEVLPYLQQLGVDPLAAGAVSIHRFAISTIEGKLLETQLPLGGFGISRYTLDELLYQQALAVGCQVIQQQITEVVFNNDYFTIRSREGQNYTAKFVIGAFGKRSNLDIKLGRSFMKRPSPYLGVKAHYAGDFPEDLVALHNFKGGYCGVSKVENGRVNVCYLAHYAAFKKHQNLAIFQKNVLEQNPYLQDVFQQMEPLFDDPLSISQVSFEAKPTVENHILMSGDSAGMIHPLCGNGMGMAIHSAQLLSTILLHFFAGDLSSRTEVEQRYARLWERTFRKRLLAGRLFNTFFQRDAVFEYALKGLTFAPSLLPMLIKQTHGKPI